MSQQDWYSCKLRFICLIKGSGAHRYMDSVYLFQSNDFDMAFKRALELGRQQEKSYRNMEGKQVVWKLKEIISLDIILVDSLDGAEVYSEPVELGENDKFPFDSEFHPELSEPTQTI